MATQIFALASAAVAAASALGATSISGNTFPGASGPYRPTQWDKAPQTSITLAPESAPATTGLQDGVDTLPGAPAYQATSSTVYVFDAILRAEHTRELRRCTNPIQTSAATPVGTISDHAYLLPSTVLLEIGMSDAMDSYSAGTWTSNASKSISAYETLVKLWKARAPFTLTTRLDTYTNMVVESIRAPDDVKTRHGLRASVLFSEIQTAQGTAASSGVTSYGQTGDAEGVPLSDRANTTATTPATTVQTAAPSAAVTDNNNIFSLPQAPPYTAGAGSWSSNSLGTGIYNSNG